MSVDVGQDLLRSFQTRINSKGTSLQARALASVLLVLVQVWLLPLRAFLLPSILSFAVRLPSCWAYAL